MLRNGIAAERNVEVQVMDSSATFKSDVGASPPEFRSRTFRYLS